MEMLTVRELSSVFDLPQAFIETLPTECWDCGLDLLITETLSAIECENPRCTGKLVTRIRTVCETAGILHFGESTIEKFLEKYKQVNPLAIFALKPGHLVGNGVGEQVSEKIISQIVAFKAKPMLLWEYVQLMNIPKVQTSARKIFSGYSNIEEAYSDIESGGVDWVQEKLGVSSEGYSISAIQVYNNLLQFKEDLFDAVGLFNIENTSHLQELNVVCSDQVGGGFGTKAEFYNTVKQEFAGVYQINFLPSVNRSIDFLVWAGADGTPARYTSKVKTVEGYNSKGANIPIVTARQLIEHLKGLQND